MVPKSRFSFQQDLGCFCIPSQLFVFVLKKRLRKSEKGSAVSSSMRTSLSKACNQTAPGRAVEIPQSLIQR